MSYDIELVDSDGRRVTFDERHDLRGGTYQMGGCDEAWLNVTYNYAKQFYRVLGEKGIRRIYGMTATESLPVLQSAIDQLDDDVSDNYWDSTDGNARASLLDLKSLAEKSPPDSIWQGD